MASPKKEKKHTGRNILIVLLALLLLIGIGGYAVVNHYLGKIDRVDPKNDPVIPPESENFEPDSGEEPDSSTPSVDPSEVSWSGHNTVTFDDSELLNILLVGQDRRSGQGRQRSDSMILCSINTKTKKVALISFLRDLYVQIPGGYSDNRLNATYAFGGFPLLNKTLKQNFGVTVDGNFEVDFESFTRVIDTLGGVDITVTAREAAYLRVNDGKAGTVHMDGALALNYSRIRYLDSDFGRTQRQRNVLMSVFEHMRGMSVGQLMDLMNVILPSLKTDMSNTRILSLMTQLAPMVSSMEVNTYRVPANNAYRSASIRGMSVLVPDLQKIRKQLRDEYLPF